jgi:hypothetical protein
MRPSPRSCLLPCSISVALVALVAVGCAGPYGGYKDASTDAPADAGADVPLVLPKGCIDTDASATLPDGGETCIGFGPGEPCSTSCGSFTYGYVCSGGSPSAPSTCVLARASLLGSTYCCATLTCTRVTLRDDKCSGTPLKRLYQCFADGDAGVIAKPSPSCGELVGDPELSSAKSRAYCCP